MASLPAAPLPIGFSDSIGLDDRGGYDGSAATVGVGLAGAGFEVNTVDKAGEFTICRF